MRKINPISLAVLFSISLLAPVLLAGSAAAQDAKPQADSKAPPEAAGFENNRFYRLDFSIREIGDDGKVMNSRAYSIVVGSDEKRVYGVPQGSIRAGSRVPVSQNGSKTLFNYQDVGVNIDSRNVHLVHLAQDELSMQVEAEISSMAPASGSDTNDTSAPVIRQNKWDSVVVLPLNKPTILFSSDNVATKGKLQLELTASAIK